MARCSPKTSEILCRILLTYIGRILARRVKCACLRLVTVGLCRKVPVKIKRGCYMPMSCVEAKGFRRTNGMQAPGRYRGRFQERNQKEIHNGFKYSQQHSVPGCTKSIGNYRRGIAEDALPPVVGFAH